MTMRTQACLLLVVVWFMLSLAGVAGAPQQFSTGVASPYRVAPNITYLTANGFDEISSLPSPYLW